jgi:hypothetical protein
MKNDIELRTSCHRPRTGPGSNAITDATVHLTSREDSRMAFCRPIGVDALNRKLAPRLDMVDADPRNDVGWQRESTAIDF